MVRMPDESGNYRNSWEERVKLTLYNRPSKDGRYKFKQSN